MNVREKALAATLPPSTYKCSYFALLGVKNGTYPARFTCSVVYNCTCYIYLLSQYWTSSESHLKLTNKQKQFHYCWNLISPVVVSDTSTLFHSYVNRWQRKGIVVDIKAILVSKAGYKLCCQISFILIIPHSLRFSHRSFRQFLVISA